MAFTVPTVDDFKARFARDFPFGSTTKQVMDQDVTNAIQDAGFDFPEDLFSTQQNFTLGYLLLSAHYLVTTLRASSQGIAGNYKFLANSSSVQGVSEAISIPQRILDNPSWSMLAKTQYGAKYLQLILPQLTGVMFPICHHTNP